MGLWEGGGGNMMNGIATQFCSEIQVFLSNLTYVCTL